MAVLSVACSRLEQTTDIMAGTDEITCISLTIPPYEFTDDDVDTKVTIHRDEASKIHYYWAETDVVGIFPSEGCQLYFSMADGVGTETVSFNGGGWAMKRDTDYYSYLPFVPDYYIDKEAIPLSYLGQKQIGNASETDGDVGEYCYMAAKGVFSEDSGILSFSYKKIGLLHRIIIPVPAGTYKSLTLNAGSDVIAYKGTFNCIDIDQKINDAEYTDNITVELEEVTFDADATLVVYMMTSPFQNLGRQISFEVKRTDGVVLSASTVGKNYNPGATAQIPAFSIYPSSASLSGAGESTELNIISNGDSSYEVATDVDWLILGSTPTSGSSVISVTALENNGQPRKGNVIVSEKVTYKNVEYTLKNIMTVSQTINGMDIGVRDWENGDDEGGSVG